MPCAFVFYEVFSRKLFGPPPQKCSFQHWIEWRSFLSSRSAEVRHHSLSPHIPPKMKRGITEENEHEQPAGTSSEPETTAQGVEPRKHKRIKNFTGLDESVSFKPGTL
ncbi:uncharacterized protein LOC122964046 [Acropora millepora]|uniref:uncharacterized protein LOC122964046 n=1 Tax=Acropora millepora TaxID=45264 RepID=UPI001CF46AB5|nr:uncharacterized protein LOC122964046 [Acropora millepora]